MTKQILILNDKLENALLPSLLPHDNYSEKSSPRRPGRSTFTDRRGSYGSGSDPFGGFFSLELHSVDGKYKVFVTDGTDIPTEKMYIKVNDYKLFIDEWASPEYTTDDMSIYFYIHVNFPGTGIKGEIIGITHGEKNIPDDTSQDIYYLIGRLVYNSVTQQVNLIREMGVPQLFWFTACEM